MPTFRIAAAFGLTSLALLGGIVSVTAAAAAGPSPQAAIEARHANFKKMGMAMKDLNGQVKSGTIDKATALADAQTVAANAKLQGALFPAGSGPAPGVKTDALPAIWTDRATFDTLMNKLVVESGKLVVAARSGDTAAITAQYKATGGVCGECHRQFRKDDH